MKVHPDYRLCPFCQGEPIPETEKNYPGEPVYYVVCRSCAARGGWAKNEQGAKRLWNTREGK